MTSHKVWRPILVRPWLTCLLLVSKYILNLVILFRMLEWNLTLYLGFLTPKDLFYQIRLLDFLEWLLHSNIWVFFLSIVLLCVSRLIVSHFCSWRGTVFSICWPHFHGLPEIFEKNFMCTFGRPLDVVGMSQKQFSQLWIIHQILFQRSSYSN